MKIIKFLVMAACLSGIVYMHVWQRVQVLKLGYEISEFEQRIEELSKQRRLLRLEYSRASSSTRAGGTVSNEFSNSRFESMDVVDVVVSRGAYSNGRN